VRAGASNAALRGALADGGAPRGAVAVVAAAGALTVALMGDAVAAAAADAGWAGVIVDGAVRDVAALGGIPLGVLARGACPRRSDRREGVWPGVVGEPVVVGGCEWRTGDYVYVDEDGVVLADRPLHLLPGDGGGAAATPGVEQR